MDLTLRQKLVAALAIISVVTFAESGLAQKGGKTPKKPIYSIVNAPSQVEVGEEFTVDVVLNLNTNSSIAQEVSVGFTPGLLNATGAIEWGVPPYEQNLSSGVRDIDDNGAGVVGEFEAVAFTSITPETPFVVGQITFQAAAVGVATIVAFFDFGSAVLDGEGVAITGVVFNEVSTAVIAVIVVPDVTITSPSDGSSVPVNTSITFAATATDPIDGDIAGDLAWDSDRDGPLGSGGSFSTSALTVGTHVITASVTNSGGVTGFDSITVIITSGGTGCGKKGCK